MSRFMEAPERVITLLNNVIQKEFPAYVNCKIKVLMDSEKRKRKGKYIFASIKKTDEKEKFFTSDNYNPEGSDFIMLIDENIWSNLTEEDKEKIIYHELLHIDFDPDANKPWKIKEHDYTGFREELEKDPNIFNVWDRITDIAESIYE